MNRMTLRIMHSESPRGAIWRQIPDVAVEVFKMKSQAIGVIKPISKNATVLRMATIFSRNF